MTLQSLNGSCPEIKTMLKRGGFLDSRAKSNIVSSHKTYLLFNGGNFKLMNPSRNKRLDTKYHTIYELSYSQAQRIQARFINNYPKL